MPRLPASGSCQHHVDEQLKANARGLVVVAGKNPTPAHILPSAIYFTKFEMRFCFSKVA